MKWLLLRGLARQALHWGEFVEIMQSQPQVEEVLTLDLPGFGTENHRNSPITIKGITNDVRMRFLKHVKTNSDINNWNILGFSLGGMVTLDWLHRFPMDFKKAGLINTSSRSFSPTWKRLYLFSVPHIVKILSAKNLANREKAIIDMICNLSNEDSKLLDTWIMYAKKYPYKMTNVVRQLTAASQFHAPKKIEHPTLVLTSRKDRMVHTSCSIKLAKFYGMDIQSHPEAGHDISTDDPDWLIRRLKEFW